MFPLPVGDLVQTLQADRERRFTTFLRMLHVSGLEDTLTGKLKIQVKINFKELNLCHMRLSYILDMQIRWIVPNIFIVF